ncbi:P-loop containing nucleoside triphosphate hydrolase protein [Mycena polygramma]|nr:P-loop containing nucleoside triphosphate hydrolase protein [Mycena polygramma]
MNDEQDDNRDAWTIALVGAPEVGKTRFISRFVLNDFEVRDVEPIESSTIERGFSRKLTVDGQETIVTLLDIYQGHRSPDGIDDEDAVETLLRNADSYILMYSTTSPYTFQDVVAYTRAVRRAKAEYPQNPVFSLVANQCDRAAQDQEVSRKEGEALARELDCAFKEASAKTGDGVEEIVEDLVRLLRARKERGSKKQTIWGYLTTRR